MKVDPRALAGIERKIARALQHFDVLRDEMTAWTESRPNGHYPWVFTREMHDKGRKHFYRLRLINPIPVDWAVVLGEAIHNLRSGLDQAVYWLTVDWEARELKGSAFPVYTKRINFEQRDKRGDWSSSGGMYKVRGIGPGPQAFIQALQPYPQRARSFYTRDMRTINDLWNQDKHRLVHLWGIRLRDPKIRLPPKLAAECRIALDRRVLHDGAIAMKMTFPRPHAYVEMDGDIGGDLTFRSGKRKGGPNESLWNTGGTAIDVIRKLVSAIGRQERPISLDVWTTKRPL